jgi:hypothetical protein
MNDPWQSKKQITTIMRLMNDRLSMGGFATTQNYIIFLCQSFHNLPTDFMIWSWISIIHTTCLGLDPSVAPTWIILKSKAIAFIRMSQRSRLYNYMYKIMTYRQYIGSESNGKLKLFPSAPASFHLKIQDRKKKFK